jgi:hypothetical protein
MQHVTIAWVGLSVHARGGGMATLADMAPMSR